MCWKFLGIPCTLRWNKVYLYSLYFLYAQNQASYISIAFYPNLCGYKLRVNVLFHNNILLSVTSAQQFHIKIGYFFHAYRCLRDQELLWSITILTIKFI